MAALDELMMDLKAPLTFYLFWLLGEARKMEEVTIVEYVKYFNTFLNILYY